MFVPEVLKPAVGPVSGDGVSGDDVGRSSPAWVVLRSGGGKEAGAASRVGASFRWGRFLAAGSKRKAVCAMSGIIIGPELREEEYSPRGELCSTRSTSLDSGVDMILAHLALPPVSVQLFSSQNSRWTYRSTQVLQRFPSFCCAEHQPRSLAWPMTVIVSADVGFRASGSVNG